MHILSKLGFPLHFAAYASNYTERNGISCMCFILESFVTLNCMNDKRCLGEKDGCKLNVSREDDEYQ